MRYEILKPEQREEYEQFVKSHPKGHFLQSLKWAQVKKADWKHEAVVVRNDENKIVGAMMLLIRKPPLLPFTLMYAGRAPVCDIYDKEVFSLLLEGAKELSKKHHSYILKMDPDVPITDEKFKKLAEELGFEINSTSQFFESVQPRYVFRLNVENKTEDELLASFHSKTRYNIRVAIKNGVNVSAYDTDRCGDFEKIMEVTGERDRFMIRNAEYFKTIMDNFGDEAKLYLAAHEDDVIGGSLAIAYGDKVWYLYGASSNLKRNMMPNYLVQWAMIKLALERGARIYDFRGVSGFLDESNPMYGIYRFKKGFNGDFVEFIGELNYVFRPKVNSFMTGSIKLYKKVRYHIRYTLKTGIKKLLGRDKQTLEKKEAEKQGKLGRDDEGSEKNGSDN